VRVAVVFCLDGQKRYFLKKDIAQFDRYKYVLDDEGNRITPLILFHTLGMDLKTPHRHRYSDGKNRALFGRF
jgi:hypothetical protein